MKMDVRHISATVVGFSSLLLIALLAGCDFMTHTRCDDKVLSKETSPDRKFVAITYARHCANSTGLYTWVGLEEASLPNQTNSETEAVLTIEGVHDIKAVWQNPRSLEIVSTGVLDGKKVLTQKDSWRTVTISYRNSPP